MSVGRCQGPSRLGPHRCLPAESFASRPLQECHGFLFLGETLEDGPTKVLHLRKRNSLHSKTVFVRNVQFISLRCSALNDECSLLA